MSDERRHRAAKTTIVGGQPPGNDRDLAWVPVGLEELLGMAAVDPAFAEALLADPDAAARAGGVSLTATERAILGALDGATLQPMIERVRVSLPKPERRAFLEQATAAVVLLVGGGAAVAAAGCKGGGDSGKKGRKATPREAADTGARPDRPRRRVDAGVKQMGRPRPAPKDRPLSRGIRPRRHPPLRGRETTGIAPDRPPRRGDK